METYYEWVTVIIILAAVGLLCSTTHSISSTNLPSVYSQRAIVSQYVIISQNMVRREVLLFYNRENSLNEDQDNGTKQKRIYLHGKKCRE